MKQTEKRERRLIVRFILIVLACGVLGYFVGMFMAEYGGNIRPLPQSAMESITRMFPFEAEARSSALSWVLKSSRWDMQNLIPLTPSAGFFSGFSPSWTILS